VSISYIDKLIDGNDNIYYPETKEKAITDDDGVVLTDKLDNITNSLKSFTVTLKASDWAGISTTAAVDPTDEDEESPPYTQSVNVDGITAEMNFQPPFIDSTGDQETDEANQEALACIAGGESSDGAVTFWCYESKPEVDLDVILVRRF
jgi:hypothetical protein